MHEPEGSLPSSVSFLQLFSWVTIAGAIFFHTAPCLNVLKSNPPVSIAEKPPSPHKTAARVLARAKMQSTKPWGVTVHTRVQPYLVQARVQPYEDSLALEDTIATDEKSVSAEATVLPLPRVSPKQGSARFIAAPPLPVLAPKQMRSTISRSDAPPLPMRAPKEVRSRIAKSGLQQTGQASWYNLDSTTASGEKMDGEALTAAHRFLPFGTKVRIENIINARSVVVRSTTVDLSSPAAVSKAAAEALNMIADGVADVRLSVIYDTVASAGGE